MDVTMAVQDFSGPWCELRDDDDGLASRRGERTAAAAMAVRAAEAPPMKRRSA